MSDYLQENLHELVGSTTSSGGVLPEDEENLIRTVQITREAFSHPRTIKLDHVYAAIEGWENIRSYLLDTGISDLAGEVAELLNDVFRNRSLSMQEARRGRETVKVLARFLGIPRRRTFPTAA